MKTSISGARCCCNTASKNTNLTFRKSPKGRWLVLSISTVTRTDAISNFYCWIQRQLFPLSHTLLQSVSFHFPSQACYAVLFSSCKHKSATVLSVQVLNGKLGNTGNLRGVSEVLLLLTYNEGRLILFFCPHPQEQQTCIWDLGGWGGRKGEEEETRCPPTKEIAPRVTTT